MPLSPRVDLGALSGRSYRRFFVGYTASSLGSSMTLVALTFAVLGGTHGEHTRPASDLGLVLMAQTLPLALLVLAGGVIADRLPRRPLMVGSDLLRLASQGSLAVLVITGQPPLWALMVLVAVVGLGQAFFNPAMTGLIPAIVPQQQLQSANALIGLSSSVGSILGPAAAGVIAAAASPGWALAVDAATYGISAISLGLLELPPYLAPVATRFIDDLHRGWREFWSRSWLWIIVTQFFFFHLLVYPPLQVLGAVVARADYGGAQAWGWILAATGAGALLGGLAMLRSRPRRPLVIATIGASAVALPLVALAVDAPVAIVAAAAAAFGAGIAVFGTLWDTTMQREIPTDVLSRVSAYDWFGSVVSLPLGYVVVGPIADGIGRTHTLWLAAGWMLATSALVLATPGVRAVHADR